MASSSTVQPPGAVYLSLDIDFFNNIPGGADQLRTYLADLTLAARARCISIRAVTNHHQMLRWVDASQATTLVNIDLHSDLASDDCEWFNCGTWVSFCLLRSRSHYHWISSGSLEDGECSPERPIWAKNGKHRASRTDWASIQRTFRRTPPSVGDLFGDPLSPIVAVGVCLSPGYSDWELQQVFHIWRRANRGLVPYMRGLRDEYRVGVERAPK